MTFPTANSNPTKVDDRVAAAIAQSSTFVDHFCQIDPGFVGDRNDEAQKQIHIDTVAFDPQDDGYFERNDKTLTELNAARPFVCIGSDYPNGYEIYKDAVAGYSRRYQIRVYFEMLVESTDVNEPTLKTFDAGIDTGKPHEVIRAWKNLAPKIIDDVVALQTDKRLDISRIIGIDAFRCPEQMRRTLGDFVCCSATFYIGPEG